MITFNLQKCSKKKIISEKNKNTKEIQILPEKIKNRKKTVHYYFMPKMIKRHTSHTARIREEVSIKNVKNWAKSQKNDFGVKNVKKSLLFEGRCAKIHYCQADVRPNEILPRSPKIGENW